MQGTILTWNMRIKTIKFYNDYKCIKANTQLDLSETDNYCALVGLNGSGKSSILEYIYFSLNKCSKFHDKRNSVLINDEIGIDRGVYPDWFLPKLPKYVIYNYSGESKIADRESTFVHGKEIISLQLDYRIWYLACLILQVLNDPIIKKFNIYSNKIAHYIEDARKDNNDEYNILIFIFIQIFGMYDIKIENKDLEAIGIRGFIRYAIHAYIRTVYKPKSNNDISKKLTYTFGQLSDLSEGQKKLLVLKLIMYLADEDSLVLLDEPDANLDIQKKRELFEMIRSCKGQVILTTHDPIMTKWMKGHLIFMKDGKQIDSDMVNAINEISGGEVSYQETLLMLAECKHFVFAEGKTDVWWIKKAIKMLNGYEEKFRDVEFFSLDSSTNVREKYETFIIPHLSKSNPKKILFLFDADEGGFNGKKQIDEIIKEYESADLTTIKQALEKQLKALLSKEEEIKHCPEEDKPKIAKSIKVMNDQILAKQKEINKKDNGLNPKNALTYYFYNHDNEFIVEGDKMDWFNVEDYMSTNLYKDEHKVRKSDIFDYFKDFLPEHNNDDIIRYYHLKVLAEKCEKKVKDLNTIAANIKTQFEKIDEYNNKEDFEGFRPLLDKILEKLELK